MSKPEFVYVIYIQSTPEKIWQALIDPEMTKEYWGRHRNVSDWKPGSEWRHQNYDDASDVAVAGTVVESEPPRRLVLTWAEPGGSDISRVAFDIDEFMGSARLTVTHTELSPEMLRNISSGWQAVLSSLKSLLETGASLPMLRRQWKKAG
ncbi:SRPBCC family protein [Bradyrhizobium sp. LjRoot220]|uniref:SRPBCC family protein n=1 Tax=Bradyrhizobium sp. LjRoot220 TaxID=3342284 RepID=UPI003ECF2EAE